MFTSQWYEVPCCDGKREQLSQVGAFNSGIIGGKLQSGAIGSDMHDCEGGVSSEVIRICFRVACSLCSCEQCPDISKRDYLLLPDRC